MKILCITQCDDKVINGVSKEAIVLGQELSEKLNYKAKIIDLVLLLRINF